jgi:hypothetical protein
MKYVFAKERYGNGMIAVECLEPEKYTARGDDWVKFKGLKRNLMFYDEGQLEPISIDMIELEPDTWSWDTIEDYRDLATVFRILYYHVETYYMISGFYPKDEYRKAPRAWLKAIFEGDTKIKNFITEYTEYLLNLLDWIQ